MSVKLNLDNGISVIVAKGRQKPFSYTVYAESEEIVSYETSANIRKPAGKIGVRNVIFRHVSDLEKDEIEAALEAAVAANHARIDQIQ